MANDWYNSTGTSAEISYMDAWYNSESDIDSSYSTDYSGWTSSDYNEDDIDSTYQTDTSTWYSSGDAGNSSNNQGGSSLLDAAGGFLSNNWKELLAMFGGGLAGGLSGSSGVSRPSGSSGGSDGSSGPTTTEALAGEYKVSRL